MKVLEPVKLTVGLALGLEEGDLTGLGVIGLGYVGLPLAVEFSKQRVVRAFDIDELSNLHNPR